MRINFQKQLYLDLVKRAAIDKDENIMLIGGLTDDNDDIDTVVGTFKWFLPSELITQDEKSASVKKDVLAKSIKNITDQGYDTIVFMHTHPCKTQLDDWLYAPLSPEEIEGQKSIQFMCNMLGAKFFSAVITGGDVYCWQIDPNSNIPTQVDCAINGTVVGKRMPKTFVELLDKLKSK